LVEFRDEKKRLKSYEKSAKRRNVWSANAWNWNAAKEKSFSRLNVKQKNVPAKDKLMNYVKDSVLSKR
jgi:hypothetical protein